MTNPPEFSDDQIIAAVASAIRDNRFDVIPGMIRVLALQSPDAAQALLDTIELGRSVGTTP